MRLKLSKHTVRTAGTGALLAVVVAAPAVASGQGLYLFGRDVVGLAGAWAALPWLVLDAAGAYAAVLSFRDVAKGDSAIVNRALVWLYTFLSAGLNVWSHGPAAGVFYGAASVSAALLWDRTLRGARRELLRVRGAVAVPTPRFRGARWVVAPRETAAAWRLAVINGLTDPAEAVALARGERNTRDGIPAPAEPIAELAGLSTAAAVRRAFEALGGREPDPVIRWLAARGVEVSRSYVYDVARRADQRKHDSTEPTEGEEGEPLRLAG